MAVAVWEQFGGMRVLSSCICSTLFVSVCAMKGIPIGPLAQWGKDLTYYLTPFFCLVNWDSTTLVAHVEGRTCLWAEYFTCLHACMRAYMHTCIHAYLHTSIHEYMHTSIHEYIQTSIHPYIHTCTHTYVYTYIYTYILTYIHTYIHTHTYICIHTLKNETSYSNEGTSTTCQWMTNTFEHLGHLGGSLIKFMLEHKLWYKYSTVVWGKTPKKNSTRKTNATRDRTRAH